MVTGIINDTLYGLWIIPRDHKDINKPLEQVTIKKTDYNKFKENLTGIERVFLLVPRTYRRLTNNDEIEYQGDISFFILIPHQIVLEEIVNKTPRTPASETTLNIGFTEKQIRKWEARGVEYYPFFE